MADNLFEEFCGPKPENLEYIKIENDPNYVFVNNPSFETKIVYDIEGKVLNVNSWLECANYIDGGWSTIPLSNVNYEQNIFTGLSIVLIILISIKYFKK